MLRGENSMNPCGLTRIATVFVLLEQVFALQLIEISVPRFKQVSGVATLRCMYDLGPSALLYSIKWYRNDAEFYRYLPRDSPPGQAFPLPGIVIDLADSDEYQVTLASLTLASTGVYKCEVSTEAPVFNTVSGEALMTIIALPTESPRIWGLQGMYSDGHLIALNCTSSYSKPVAHLSWYINGIPADVSWLIKYGVETDGTSDLDRATLGLRVTASPQLFHGRVMGVRCVASLAQRTWQHQRWTILYQPPASHAMRRECSWLHMMAILLMSMVILFEAS